MSRSVLSLLLCLAGPLVPTTAQVQISLNPRATHLGTANGSSDSSRNLVCVFRSAARLLTPVLGLVERVPGSVPIVHGAPWRTDNTQSSNRPTDIGEDFVVARTGWSNGATAQVPTGAVFTPTTPAVLQGTAEHCELRTGLNGSPTATPEVKLASSQSTLSVECAQRFGPSTGDAFLIAVNVHATGGSPPVGPLPDRHVGNNLLVVQTGVMTTAPGQWSLFVPPGYAGNTLVGQAFFVTPTARNGLLSASNAHRIELQ